LIRHDGGGGEVCRLNEVQLRNGCWETLGGNRWNSRILFSPRRRNRLSALVASASNGVRRVKSPG
jgi:hypothetical protein